MKLLLIEDEEDLRRALVRGLTKLGYSTDSAADGVRGLACAQTGEYDLIILDLNLPGMDGLEILRAIRRENWAQKILILSARTAVHDRVAGLDLGANDYLVKPFDFEELAARVGNLLRRRFVQQPPTLRYGAVSLDTRARLAFGAGEAPLRLTPKEFTILEYLLANQGRPVSAEELIAHAWAEEEADLFSNAVKVQISLLRKKLAEAGCADMIETVRGAGYCIRAEGGQDA